MHAQGRDGPVTFPVRSRQRYSLDWHARLEDEYFLETDAEEREPVAVGSLISSGVVPLAPVVAPSPTIVLASPVNCRPFSTSRPLTLS